MFTITNEIDIYLGLPSKLVNDNNIFKSDAVQLIVNYFTSINLNYSISVVCGGYMAFDGTYISEDSACFILVSPPENFVKGFSNFVKKAFSQESVLLVNKDVEVMYLE